MVTPLTPDAHAIGVLYSVSLTGIATTRMAMKQFESLMDQANLNARPHRFKSLIPTGQLNGM